ncbi:hypothetical protein CC1G_15106 [Coprinopsis cinerea okayama7|uniref:Uncharacterized protein n=1 Tax=Coprinopsis cinerea (strain Okayama-7 / 130 / ATCC MYA-4618 / FGSC 9003) TaxID=240176 RepID=D6RPG8_COPC7|nr:hypothetical protein CC1G_15106 [Coprinopsis cinerea okayama7\|eukprot:XP_002910465.1 hypothetical protein CC1G_15106 [Coprinopsis cinerea okayama7\
MGPMPEKVPPKNTSSEVQPSQNPGIPYPCIIHPKSGQIPIWTADRGSPGPVFAALFGAAMEMGKSSSQLIVFAVNLTLFVGALPRPCTCASQKISSYDSDFKSSASRR